ncbi:ATP-binding protein [Corynebacterium pacaense]|uniref:ATP-binding protein n=1 Tax=Corynebacterium pacaense TaxID=1816684 RepID=UPI003CCC0D1A
MIRSAYRIIQEGLTNAHKHGAQKTAELSITVSDDKLEISITNPVASDGSNASGLRGEGLGLIGIKERVESVRGTVAMAATEDSFRCDASLPLRQQELS